MLNMNEYESMTVEECWNRYGWGCEAKENTTIYHRVIGEYEIFCDEMNDAYSENGNPCFGCEIFKGEDMEGQWFAESYEEAIRGAMVDAVGTDVLREEDNCEDAVNSIAYEAYQSIFGETPISEMDREQIDMLLAVAREYVKSHGRFFGIEWEEF